MGRLGLGLRNGIDSGQLRGNFGVRYVYTDVDSAGYVCNLGSPCSGPAINGGA